MITGALIAPVAIRMQESLVEVSPSTVMQLNDLFTAWRSMASSASHDTGASVATKDSMVAMFG
jgi:hypothetical protein